MGAQGAAECTKPARGACSTAGRCATIPNVEIVNVRITTVTDDNVARRCDGCLEVIAGTPWRINILDIVAPERAADWTDAPAINPGPFEFHPDPDHVRRWMAAKGYLFCRKGEVREIMRPIPIPAADGGSVRWALCDGIHRDDHEIVPA